MSALSPAQQITAAGQQLTFTCPHDQMTNPASAVVFNKSPYELTYLNELIPAWSIMPFGLDALLGGTTSMILTTLLAPSVSVPGAASVYVQWLAQGEDVPDQMAFIADAVASAITSINTQTQIAQVAIPAGTSTGAVAYPIPSNTVGIGVFLIWPLNPIQPTDALSVVGAGSGASIINVGGNPPALGIPAITDTYYEGIVAPGVDTQVQVAYSNNGAHGANIIVIAYSQLPTAATHLVRVGALGISGGPVITSEGGGTHTPASVQATAGGAALLAAPTAGYVWDLRLLSIFANTATTNAGNAFIKGATTGTFYLGTTVVAAAATVPPAVWGGKMRLAEGLTAVTGLTGANLECQAVARLMPDIR